MSDLRFGTQDRADELLPNLRERPTAENIEPPDVPPLTAIAQPGEEPEPAPAVVPPVVVDIAGARRNELRSQPRFSTLGVLLAIVVTEGANLVPLPAVISSDPFWPVVPCVTESLLPAPDLCRFYLVASERLCDLGRYSRSNSNVSLRRFTERSPRNTAANCDFALPWNSRLIIGEGSVPAWFVTDSEGTEYTLDGRLANVTTAYQAAEVASTSYTIPLPDANFPLGIKAILPSAWIRNNAYGFNYTDEEPQLTGFSSFTSGVLSFYPLRYDYPQPLFPIPPRDAEEFPDRVDYCREVRAYTKTDRRRLRLRPSTTAASRLPILGEEDATLTVVEFYAEPVIMGMTSEVFTFGHIIQSEQLA